MTNEARAKLLKEMSQDPIWKKHCGDDPSVFIIDVLEELDMAMVGTSSREPSIIRFLQAELRRTGEIVKRLQRYTKLAEEMISENCGCDSCAMCKKRPAMRRAVKESKTTLERIRIVT